MSAPSCSYDRGSRGDRGNGGRERDRRDDRGRLINHKYVL